MAGPNSLASILKFSDHRIYAMSHIKLDLNTVEYKYYISSELGFLDGQDVGNYVGMYNNMLL